MGLTRRCLDVYPENRPVVLRRAQGNHRTAPGILGNPDPGVDRLVRRLRDPRNHDGLPEGELRAQRSRGHAVHVGVHHRQCGDVVRPRVPDRPLRLPQDDDDRSGGSNGRTARARVRPSTPLRTRGKSNSQPRVPGDHGYRGRVLPVHVQRRLEAVRPLFHVDLGLQRPGVLPADGPLPRRVLSPVGRRQPVALQQHLLCSGWIFLSRFRSRVLLHEGRKGGDGRGRKGRNSEDVHLRHAEAAHPGKVLLDDRAAAGDADRRPDGLRLPPPADDPLLQAGLWRKCRSRLPADDQPLPHRRRVHRAAEVVQTVSSLLACARGADDRGDLDAAARYSARRPATPLQPQPQIGLLFHVHRADHGLRGG